MKKIFAMLLLLPLLAAAEVKPYTCSFRSAAGWNREEWAPVRSPRFPEQLKIMEQQAGCIGNPIPAELSDADVLKTYGHQAYAGMLLKQELAGDAEISCTMSFDDQMAPLLLIAAEPDRQPDGSMLLRAHYEVVIFNEGINVWDHRLLPDGKPFWILSAFSRFRLLPKTEYRVTVRITADKKSKLRRLTVSCDGHNFAYLISNLPEKYRVGLIGCEGRNRFYDFQVKPR